MFKKEVEVVAAIIKKGKLYYVVQRPHVGEVGGKWEFPGGKIQPAETHQSALKREIKEELNCEINSLSFVMTVEHEYNSFKIRLHFYFCSLLSNLPKLSEHISEKWVTKIELLELDLAEADKYVLPLLD